MVLDRVRVIDLTTVVAGPLASLVLAQQGAEVIKVEPPGGDLIRRLGFIAKDGASSTHHVLGRGKRLIRLDLSTAAGRDALERLLKDADVLLHNYRPGVAERMGLDADALRRRHPRLIIGEVTGFGPSGPLKTVRAYDPVIQAESGLAARPGGQEPALYPQYICDKVSGMYLVQAVTAALYAREKDGRGRRVEVSMLEAATAFSWMDVHMSLTLADPAREGPSIAKVYRPWKAKGGWFVVVMLSEKEFTGWCEAVGADELLSDERCADMASRFLNWDTIRQVCEPRVEQIDIETILARLREKGVPAGKVNTSDEMLTHAQLAASDFLYEAQAGKAGPVRLPGSPARFDGERPGMGATAKGDIGADTRAVLSEAGFSDDEIDTLTGQT
ncbi:CoA transferase [Marinicauda algicola]|uniref:CoA transferase n=1 Tax=Marinicauda algicola TaxID=2029849 RepID=A0A4S2H3J2_9PROT|nr:CoA transferase [Marinicauda algicola]TGY89938.1 CoA transferase [Marinicauda algicola]